MIRVSRLGVIHGGFVLFAVALLGRAGWVQLGQTERWRGLARQQQTLAATIPAARGTIRDAAGTVLVESRSLVRLAIAPRELRAIEPIARGLREVRVTPEWIARATDTTRKWVELPGRFLSTDVATLSAMRGVHATPVLERVPPATDGLRRLVGRTDGDGKAIDGLESALDSILTGTPGKAALVRDSRGGRFASPEEQGRMPVPGHDVVLTLHQGLQDIAERALADAVTELQASGGDIVVLDPHTGEVRALASRRADPRSTGASALIESYEPGSTLKPFIAAALLEKGRVRLDEVVNTYDGRYTINGRTITDVHKASSQTFAEVIQHSSNIGIVQFATRLSAREQYEALRDAGFGMATGAPYPSESNGRLRPPSEWSKQSGASLAMGYEIAVTPLQLAAAYGAIANGGELLIPALVKEIRSAKGELIFKHERQVVRRAMSPGTARVMRDLLRDVVASGTATTADLATFDVAGKSGTARRVSTRGKGYEAGAYTASFVGLFPAEKPQYVIVVKLDNPQGAYYGGRTAAPVSRVVLEAAIAARDAALDRASLANAPSRIAAMTRPDGTDSLRAVPPTGTPEATRDDGASTTIVVELGGTDTARIPVVTRREIPDVRGLSTRAAVHALHRAGFRVALAPASGGAGTTEPAAGSSLASGATVRLQPNFR